ncbi:MAG: cytochrome c [Kofleriaceae bacterium]
MSCASCHTANPSANVSKVLKGANDASQIQQAITRNTGGMGVLNGRLSAAELADIAAYLATPNI